MDLNSKIGSILFFRGEPMQIKKLAEILSASKREIIKGIEELEKKFDGSGITIIRAEDDVMLGTSKENCEIIEKIRKEELTRNLGKAGLETMTIILYMSPITKSRVDYIRGVNSSTILRNLMVRGIVKRTENPKNRRTYLYIPTVNALAHIGVNAVKDLPEHETIQKSIAEFEETGGILKELEEYGDLNQTEQDDIINQNNYGKNGETGNTDSAIGATGTGEK